MNKKPPTPAQGAQGGHVKFLHYKPLDEDFNIKCSTLEQGSTASSASTVSQPASHTTREPQPIKSAPPQSSYTSKENYDEYFVCKVDDLKDGEMREVDIGEDKALLVREKGEYMAVGSKCSHFGAPLVTGVLYNGHVRCPWHGACFSVKTGDIEDFPGVDSLPKFEVEISGDQVKVKCMKNIPRTKRLKAMTRHSASQSDRYLIIGGGAAALTCAETLRQEGFKGQIVMITKDNHLPYDRTKLSKMMHIEPENAVLRKAEFFSDYDIEVHKDTEVIAVNTEENSVTLKNGKIMSYTKLLLSTGTVARQILSTPGHDLKNIQTLRTLDDAGFIAKEAVDKEVVIIGTSFIGVETAAYLVEKAKSVTIVDLVEAPFQLALGKEVGIGVKKLLEENGVKFYFKNSAKEFVGEEGVLKEVVLQDDTRLHADLCVVGIGVVPATDFLKSSDIVINERGFVSVDQQLRTNKNNVFAAGDITHFPLFMMDNEKVNIQHWQMALKQGQVAALNMLDKSENIRSVPFFWTMLFKKSIRYTGYGFGYDDILMHGNPEDLKFVAYYTKGDKVIAVASMNEDPIAAQAAEYFLSGKTLTKDMVRSGPKDWIVEL